MLPRAGLLGHAEEHSREGNQEADADGARGFHPIGFGEDNGDVPGGDDQNGVSQYLPVPPAGVAREHWPGTHRSGGGGAVPRAGVAAPSARLRASLEIRRFI